MPAGGETARDTAQNSDEFSSGAGGVDEPQAELLELAAAAAGVGTFDWNLTSGVLLWDEQLLELFGYGPFEFDQTIEGFNARLHPDDLDRVSRILQKVLADCGEYEAEYRVVLPSGELRWIAARGKVLCDEAGTAVRMLGAAWEVTARRQAQDRQARAAARELLLARIPDELIDATDPEDAGASLARLVVPVLGSWCAVVLIDSERQPHPSARLRHAGSWHEDPAKQPLVETLARHLLADLLDEQTMARSLRHAQPRLLDFQATAAMLSRLRPGPGRDLLAELSPAAMAWLPLIGRRGPMGWLTVVNDAARGPFTTEDLTTLRHLAARAALVLDNARLYRQQQALAERLQRSLLTPPPEPDHLQVAVRYQPAAEAAEVGGDWYDAFIQPGGATVLVIGDVAGHDADAAVAMGQLRAIVRTLGASDDAGPAAILAKTERVMTTLAIHTVATAIVARLEQSAAELRQGLTRLRWSNAGHPAPMVIHPDGTVAALHADGVDLLLGVQPLTPRRESQAVLERGAVVLLYTDGLVERRGQPIDVGMQRLQETLMELAGLELEQLCDQLLRRLLSERPEDDVALVAVRLHPQNGPRPPDAGPVRLSDGVTAAAGEEPNHRP